MPTIRECLRKVAGRFDAARLDQPNMLARSLVAHTVGRAREWVLAHDEEELMSSQIAQLEGYVTRIMAHEPLAYVVRQRAFYGMNLFVDDRVLIPRPETELLVELVCEKTARLAGLAGGQPIHILEIGTGSGAAIIAIARELPHVNVLATDISANALEVAQLNAANQGVAHRLVLVRSNLLEDLEQLVLDQVTILIANLPYIAPAEIAALQTEIVNHEPHVALDGGGTDGLELIRTLLSQIKLRCSNGRLRGVYLEHGALQGSAALAAARVVFSDTVLRTVKDLAGLDRVLAIEF